MQYRVAVLIPTEMYIDADSLEAAKTSVEWLLDQYPPIDAPASTESNTRMDIFPKIMTVEGYDAPEE